MSSGLFRVAKGSGFTVCCFRLSVEGWETAQTELGPPMGGIPRLGGRGYIGRRGRREALGGTSKAAGRSPRRFSDPRSFWRRENSGDGSGDFGLRFGDGKRPRRSWALRKEGSRMGDREPWAGRPRRRAGLHGDSPTRAPFGEGECGGLFAVCCLLFAVWGRATAQTELGPP